jgi:hypothetical protein
MNLQAIQAALAAQKLDGWLFCDHHRRDATAYGILGLSSRHMASRRWFYWLPATGEPVKLAHRVEPRMLDTLPGRQEHYLAWTELHQKLKAIVGGAKKIAMQYSPENNIPYIGLVDAGTVELIRSFGPTVVTSADLVQQFEATFGDEGLASHTWAGERVQRIRDEIFASMGSALSSGAKVTEYEFKERIVRRFADEGLTCEGESPIVGFNDHPPIRTSSRRSRTRTRWRRGTRSSSTSGRGASNRSASTTTSPGARSRETNPRRSTSRFSRSQPMPATRRSRSSRGGSTPERRFTGTKWTTPAARS